MKKYDVRFCECGTVHFTECDLQNKVFFDNDNNLTHKEIIHVCLKCGATFIEGLDEYDYDEETGQPTYSHYARNLENSMNGIDSEKYYVILSKGVRLMMESGGYADGFRGDLYIDENSLKEEIGNSDLSRIEGVSYWVKNPEYKLRDVKAVNVNMSYLLKQITQEQAEAMCGYYMKSFDWVGTPYEKEFHK